MLTLLLGLHSAHADIYPGRPCSHETATHPAGPRRKPHHGEAYMALRAGPAMQPLSPNWQSPTPEARMETYMAVDFFGHSCKIGTWGLRYQIDPFKPVQSQGFSFIKGLQGHGRVYPWTRVALGILVSERKNLDDRVTSSAFLTAPSAGIGLPLKDWTLEIGVNADVQWAFQTAVINTPPESAFSFATAGITIGLLTPGR